MAHAEKRWVWRKISNSSEGDKVTFYSPTEILSTVDTFVEKSQKSDKSLLIQENQCT